MATITKRTNKSGTYYYLVESARINGKPRLVTQKYLGSAESIANAVACMSSGAPIPEPEFSTVFHFGAVTALYNIAHRLGVCDIIDQYACKREQGLAVSSSILLAAINRAIDPTSKNSFYEWFDKTVLFHTFPNANEKNLSSQGFWNNMNVLNEQKIHNIEDNIVKIIVEKYDIKTNFLLFDNTNFFTYLDTANPANLAQRGHSKEKRSDLKIVGLSMMVSADHNIPLFHEVYPGNRNDAKQFFAVIDKLKNRYRSLGKGDCDVTLVFDKGNNNEDNIEQLISPEPCEFHFVGSLRLNQCPELCKVPKEKFEKLDGLQFEQTTVYRKTKLVYGKKYTVVMTHNIELYKAQMEGVQANITKCTQALVELKERLRMRRIGMITKGKNPTAASVEKNICSILSAEHMKDIFDWSIVDIEQDKTPGINFGLNKERFLQLQEEKLGRTVIFTDRHKWTNEQIVGAFRSQYHIEDAFKQMKDIKYLSFRPIYHFTDAHIRVHAFYCVLAMMLVSLLNKELEEMGYKMSINYMLRKFQDAQQVISIFPSSGKKMVTKISYSRLDGFVKEYVEKFNLLSYAS